MERTLVILSKSAKYNKNCVAGIDINNGEIIRLVSEDEDSRGAISDEEMTYPDGRIAEPLDMVKVHIKEDRPLKHQIENKLMDMDKGLEFVKKVSIYDLLKMGVIEKKGNIFNFQSEYCNIIEENNELNRSLALVEVEDVTFKKVRSSKGYDKTKVDFVFDKKKYSTISVTDRNYFYETEDMKKAVILMSLPLDPLYNCFYQFAACIFPIDVNNECIKKMNEISSEFKKYYGEDAEFRPGQMEAIMDVLDNKRILVVQKTGWGKSLVYFLATKMMRKKYNNEKFTIIISPLIVLMDNQIESAKKLGLNVKTINSSSKNTNKGVFDEIENKNVDALIISPERLANKEFRNELERVVNMVGLFVIDEAHCISDWGHDFRPDYRRIVDILKNMPSTTSILATTATANDRVVEDIKRQLGEDIQIHRGSIVRKSLRLECINLETNDEKLVWLDNNIDKLPGTGIIYCLTIRDCKIVNKWLNSRKDKGNYEAYSMEYHSKIESEEKKVIETLFSENKIKVLVATVAFGMGYDKPDIGFVVHYQKPGNVIAYYQQIGRAGRALERAYCVLLYSSQDDNISKYFINTAFPSYSLMNEIVNFLIENPNSNLSSIESAINESRNDIQAALKYMDVEGDIYREGYLYNKSAKEWNVDTKKINEITEKRENELEQMNEFVRTRGCYMKFIAELMDDDTATNCNVCSNCTGKTVFSNIINENEVKNADSFIKENYDVIEPRKKYYPDDSISMKSIPEDKKAMEGIVLSMYGDSGWGRIVSNNKYRTNPPHFDDVLVDASYKALKDFVIKNDIRWVTAVSSLRLKDLVRSFSKRLAYKLNLPYYDTIIKKNKNQQKEFNNSRFQFVNARDSFEVIDLDNIDIHSENVLLIDDMIDSGWTFTVCAMKLREKGSGDVYPFALARTSKN